MKLLTKRQIIFPLIALAAALALWASPRFRPREKPSAYRSFPIMGTFAEVSLYGEPQRTEKAADIIYEEFLRVEKACNIFDPESEISKLNKTAFDSPFKCSPLLWDILQKSRNAFAISEGSFDITAKPLMNLWGFYRKRKALPSEDEVKEAMRKTGMQKVIFDDENHTVKFTIPDMSFDLGGIAKGYAVDLAAKAARKLEIKSGIINLAGNMYCFPVLPHGKKEFLIGIRNPKDKNTVCGELKLPGGTSVATSGDYERYVEIDGKRFTHIMDIKTGQPVSGMLSVTVVTPLAVNADIFSTSIFINGAAFAKKLCGKVPATSALIIREDKTASGTPEITKIGSIWGKIDITERN